AATRGLPGDVRELVLAGRADRGAVDDDLAALDRHARDRTRAEHALGARARDAVTVRAWRRCADHRRREIELELAVGHGLERSDGRWWTSWGLFEVRELGVDPVLADVHEALADRGALDQRGDARRRFVVVVGLLQRLVRCPAPV